MGFVEWLVFELDGTIVDDEGAVREGAALWARSHNSLSWMTGRSFPERWSAALRETTDSFLRGECSANAAHRNTVRIFDQSVDGETCAALFERFHELYLSSLRVFPDVPEAFFRLRGQLQLGLVARGEAGVVREKLRRLGIADLFSEVVIYRDGGASVSEMLEPFLRKVGRAGERIAFVGGGFSETTIAVRRQGIRGVWLNRSSHRRSPDVPTVHTFDEVVEMLQPLVCPRGAEAHRTGA